MCDYGHLQDDDWLGDQRQKGLHTGGRDMAEEQGMGVGPKAQPAFGWEEEKAGSKGSGWVGDFGHLEGPR